jgi:hypothetical protein
MDKDITPTLSNEKLLEVIESLEMDFDNPTLILDNKLVFFYEGKMYRLTMPSQYDRAIAEEKKTECYTRLVQSGKYLTKKQLREVLIEKQGLDIDGLELKQLELLNKRKELYFKLANKQSDEEKAIMDLKEQIEESKRQHFYVSLELYNYLSKSIEDQIEKEYVEYLASVLTQTSPPETSDPEEDKNWSKVWNTFDDFKKETGQIAEVAVKAMGDLLISTKG